jgi:hypothetical protein
MKRHYIKIGVVAVVLLGFAGLVGYQFSGGNEFSSNMPDLKAQFNKDNGNPLSRPAFAYLRALPSGSLRNSSGPDESERSEY